MKKLPVLLCCLIVSGSLAQKIQIIKPEKGVKEIDLTRPVTPAKVEPIPGQNGLYRFTHRLGVICDTDGGERGELIQYLNVSNGVTGLFRDDIARIVPEMVNQTEGNMHFWAILPDHSQRMYVETREHGRLVMQQSVNDPHTGAAYTLTAARFDAFNDGQIFWHSAKKVKPVTLPASLLEGAGAPLTFDLYTFNSEEGPVQILLKDLGTATGQWATLGKIHAAVGMGGIGYVHNAGNNHVYLVFSISNGQSGCRLYSLSAQQKSFSGAGFKPAGDLILDRLAESQKEQAQQQAERQAEISAEEDATLRQLYQKQERVRATMQKKMTDAMANAGLFNDMNELASLGPDAETTYQLADIGLQIEQRKLQLELAQLTEAGASYADKQPVQRKLSCIPGQRQLWLRYRNEVVALRKRYKKPDTDPDYREKSSRLLLRVNEEVARSCPD